MSAPTRKIGNATFSAIGYGAMWTGKPLPDDDRFKVLDAAFERGCTFWDTADVYADSEDLLGKWFKRTGKRSEIFLATKFGIFMQGERVINGSPEYAKESIDKSLKRLGVDYVDLYYLHRPDVTVPIEHTVGAMAGFVKAGKVKYLGLSECSAETLRRAHAVHPISAIQVEYSPFTLDIEDEKIGLLKTARELGIAIVAYSPLGKGLLTGQYKSPNDFPEDDLRRATPRYSSENFPNILKLVDGLKTIGQHHNATAGQVALAWLLAQGDDVIPIPGTRQIKYLNENLGSAKIQLSSADLQKVRAEAQAVNASGKDRYPAQFMHFAEALFADTPQL